LRKRAEKRYPALIRKKLQGMPYCQKQKVPQNQANDNSIENFAVNKLHKNHIEAALFLSSLFMENNSKQPLV